MKVFNGIPVSPGVAIGEAFVYTKDLLIPRYSISEIQIKMEIDRFYTALNNTKKEFIQLKTKLSNELSDKEGKFLDSHILMTEDQSLIKEVIDKVKKEKKNIEWIIYQVTNSLIKTFNKMEDDYFRDRAVDILDISRKVMQKLLAKKSTSLSSLEKDVVVISSDITISDTASMNKNHILAFVTEFGGQTSHVSILSRALGIPSVFGIPNLSHIINTGDYLIVDGFKGSIIVNPDSKTKNEFNQIQTNYKKKEDEYLSIKDKPAETKDGVRVKINANVEVPEQELEFIVSHGAEGIGLYRSEFLYLSKKLKILPSEEQQFNAYKFVLQKFPNDAVTIRTLDLGGDKVLHNVTEKELNPYLGWRAIRFCLARPDIFKTQLRALYRASIYGNLKIMFPMISGLEELLETKKIIADVKKDLKKSNIKFKDDVPIGIMVETPSAALVSDVLAEHSDFFSIGTNDLIQYTLVCDRGNEKVAYLYEPLHPAILRILKLIIDNAHKANINVSLCGEMGSEVENVVVLLGMGIDELSMNSISIPEVKEVIRQIKISDVKKLVDEILVLKNYTDIIRKVKNWCRRNIKFIYNT
jgi:phosphotransferase system enzyme I (PtsI)